MKMNEKFRFVLQMDSGANKQYPKGTQKTFFIKLKELVRAPIEKDWKIVSCDQFAGVMLQGKEAYANDIVSHVCDMPDSDSDCPMFSEYGVIAFENGVYGLRMVKTERFFPLNSAPFNLNELHILGNIHDNSDLLLEDQKNDLNE